MLKHQYSIIGVLILISAFLLQTLTISYLPGIGQDEVQITDYGRLSIYPHSDWSMTWMVGNEKPLFLWTYIGPLIAETSFHLGGSSGIGPRIASLLGGLLASIFMMGWLMARRISPFMATCLSLAFLLDPLFNLSQRMGRSDSWVIALCLASCWVLRNSVLIKDRNKKIQFMIAGGLAGAAALVWPSVLLLYPLILLELWEALISEHPLRKRILYTGRFISGGVIVVILLLIPIWQNLYIIFGDMINMVNLNVNSSKSSFDKLTAVFNFNNWLKLVKTFVKTFSPIFPLIGLLSLLFRGQMRLKLGTLVTLVMIFSSLIYEFRLLYLLPYFVALAGEIFTQPANKPINKNLYLLGKTGLIICLSWAIIISIFVRSGYALEKQTKNDREKINNAADKFIGPGHHKVFLAFTYEFYFAGRALGWELYTPYIEFTYDQSGNWIRKKDFKPDDKFKKLLSRMDYAVFAKGSINKEISSQLQASGLIYKNTISLNKEISAMDGDRDKKIFMSFLFGYKNYGSYLLYAKN